MEWPPVRPRDDLFHRLCRARDLLREDREQPLTIRDIARDIALSPAHFIRRFEALFGETPHQFRLDARTSAASARGGPALRHRRVPRSGLLQPGELQHPVRAPGASRAIGVSAAGLELALEPNAGKAFQEAIFTQGIPIAAFEVDDIDREHRRLKDAGVVFTQPPMPAGPVMLAIFSDTCGNLIQLYQAKVCEARGWRPEP